MNIIIPRAGLGPNAFAHTRFTTAQPLLPIAGKPLVHRLVEDIAKVCPEKVENIGVHHSPQVLGNRVEADLKTRCSGGGR